MKIEGHQVKVELDDEDLLVISASIIASGLVIGPEETKTFENTADREAWLFGIVSTSTEIALRLHERNKSKLPEEHK